MGAKQLYREIKEKEIASIINKYFYKFVIIDEMNMKDKMDYELLEAFIETDFECFAEFKAVLHLFEYCISNCIPEELTEIECLGSKELVLRYKYLYNNIKEIGCHNFKIVLDIDRIFYRNDSDGLFYFFLTHNSSASYLFNQETREKINDVLKKYRYLNDEGTEILCKNCERFNQEIANVLDLKIKHIYENIYTFLLNVS